ncbi:MAG: type II secretion system protein [Syntrophales bacterium]
MINKVFTAKSTAPQEERERRFPIRKHGGVGLQAGFTLIEIVVSLALVGIMAALGGMMIAQVVQGYMTTRENSVMAQQSQLAMSRITREIIEMINIPSDATATALPINSNNGNRIIGLDSGAVKIALSPDTLANGDILINNVSAFTLTYYSRNPSSGAVVTAATWPASNDITTLTAIDVNLQLNRAGGGVLTFVNRVAPRNNRNQGGAVPSAAPPTAAKYGCFVATAAYGDPGHPMVQILSDFRDRCLLTWRGGRWLVKEYYEHSPAAAELIRNRPPARWLARFLLAPIVAGAFMLVHAPLAIPFLILVSLILTGALFSSVRRGLMPLRAGPFRARGSILVGLIVTMVIMSALGAAMLPLFSAAYLNQAYADQGRKAYFLAESGFRYAASQYLNAGSETGRLAAMTELNGGAVGLGKTCNLLNNAGSFKTRVYPYWFKTQAAAAGATTLTTQVYGTIPAEFTGAFAAGQIRVGDSYYSYTAGNGAGTVISFSGLSPALSAAIPATPQLDVQPVTQPGSLQSLSKGGSIILSGTGSAVFPLLNGNFSLSPTPAGIPSGAVFNYGKRTGATLSDVTLSDGDQNVKWTSAVNVPVTTKVVLEKFLRLSSTATLGSTTREVIYNVPISGNREFIKQQDHDPGMTGWQAPAGGGGGTHSVQTVDGGSALKVDTAASGGIIPGNWAIAYFNGYTNTNLAKSWMDAGGCLSYDIQVKVYNTQPYFMTGVGFRVRNNSDTPADQYNYGVSFIRQRQTRYTPTNPSSWGYEDGINTELRPTATWTSSVSIGGGAQARYSQPSIILWQRNGPATGVGSYKLLAYRSIVAADGLTSGSGTALRLKPWVSLMVRLAEGYLLPFSRGRVDSVGRHLKYGDVIRSAAGTKTARIIGTPIVSANWGAANTIVGAGRLILTNRPLDSAGASAPFINGEDLYLVDGDSTPYGRASGAQAATKANFIMVYYSDNKSPAAGNAVQADNTRIGNQRGSVNWPPDDWTDRAASNDYFSLIGGATSTVRWTGLYTTADSQGYAASYVTALSSTDLYRAVIRTEALVSPPWTRSSTAADFKFVAPSNFRGDGDNITLITSSGTATSTSYDDFAIQLEQRGGAGFLAPIQQ